MLLFESNCNEGPGREDMLSHSVHLWNRSLKVAVQGPDHYGLPFIHSFIHPVHLQIKVDPVH
jgi:hypothetical protein